MISSLILGKGMHLPLARNNTSIKQLLSYKERNIFNRNTYIVSPQPPSFFCNLCSYPTTGRTGIRWVPLWSLWQQAERKRRSCKSPNFTWNTGLRKPCENTRQYDPFKKGHHQNKKCDYLLVSCLFLFFFFPVLWCFISINNHFDLASAHLLLQLLKSLVIYLKSWCSDHLIWLVCHSSWNFLYQPK